MSEPISTRLYQYATETFGYDKQIDDMTDEVVELEAKLEAMERVLFKADVAFGFIDFSNSACVDMYMRRSYEDYKRESQIAAQEEQGEGE